MATTAQLSLTKLVEGQASAEVTINDALNKLDATIQLAVKDRDLTAPPGSPAEGDRYIVAASATGDWSGQDGNVAVYLTGWTFITAKEGFRAWVDDENRFVTYDGSAWVYRTSSEIAADASGTQAGGTPITTEVVLLSTVGATTHSVTLPTALAGDHVLIYNNSGTSAMIYPASGEKIDGLATNAARAIGGNIAYDFWCVKDGIWAFG
jgi:hypothetical protein